MAKKSPEQPDHDDKISHSEKEKLVRLAQKNLRITAENRRGEELEGIGTFVRIPEIEGQIFLANRKLVRRNPNQPREYFSERRLAALKASIVSLGQQQAIDVVPCIDKKNEVYLLIIDGERRDRVLEELGEEDIIIRPKWVSNRRELLEVSFMANDGREGHNPIERAKVFSELIAMERATGNLHPIPEVAKRIGEDVAEIKKHIKLLTLPAQFQRMIAEGTLPTTAALNIVATRKKFGKDLNMARLARMIVDNLGTGEDLDENNPDKPVPVTVEAVRKLTYRVLAQGGSQEEVEALKAQEAIVRITSATSRVRRAAEEVINLGGRKVIPLLRNKGRGQPPELIRDRIRDLIAKLTRVLTIAEAASRPDPLPKIPGKPDFSTFLNKGCLKQISPDKNVQSIIATLAKASDTEGGTVLRARQLHAELKIDINDVSRILRRLPDLLRPFDIELQRHEIRDKSLRGDYEIVNAYRLGWIQKGQKTTRVTTPTGADEIDPRTERDAEALALLEFKDNRLERGRRDDRENEEKANRLKTARRLAEMRAQQRKRR